MNLTPLKTLTTMPSIYMFSLNVASTASGLVVKHAICVITRPLQEYSELSSCTTDAFQYTVFPLAWFRTGVRKQPASPKTQTAADILPDTFRSHPACSSGRRNWNYHNRSADPRNRSAWPGPSAAAVTVIRKSITLRSEIRSLFNISLIQVEVCGVREINQPAGVKGRPLQRREPKWFPCNSALPRS